MSSQSAAAQGSQSLLSRPSNTVAYVAILGALVSSAIHLFLAPSVIGFSQITGILFYLNGLGWIGGILVFLSRFWRRELYLVATGYALVTIIAFFLMGSGLDGLAIAAKIAEGVVAVTTVYLYTAENPA
jgi:hypothetical protein